MSEFIQLDVQHGVAVITLNRPERMNAVNLEMGEALDAALAQAAFDPAVRVVVLTGAGDRAFCAGADLARLEGIQAGTESHASTKVSPLSALDWVGPELRSRYTAPLALKQPVIAALNGVSVGAGFVLAAACDIRFASEAAGFRGVFAQRGLIAESGLAWTLGAIVGRGVASDLLLSGRLVGAQEALKLGLVNAVVPGQDLLAHTIDYAREIARTASPRSLAIIKRQLRLAGQQTFAEAYELAATETATALKSDDFREGVASFRERRDPVFSGG